MQKIKSKADARQFVESFTEFAPFDWGGFTFSYRIYDDYPSWERIKLTYDDETGAWVRFWSTSNGTSDPHPIQIDDPVAYVWKDRKYINRMVEIVNSGEY